VRVLAVDDQKDILATIGTMLRGSGHEVTLVQDADTALKQVEAGGFDVLITDVLMPDKDGIEVIKALRRRHPELWIVAMSGGGRKIAATVSLKLSEAFGADRVLFKPFRRAELLAAITRS